MKKHTIFWAIILIIIIISVITLAAIQNYSKGEINQKTNCLEYDKLCTCIGLLRTLESYPAKYICRGIELCKDREVIAQCRLMQRQDQCSTDSDCIPIPSECHPMTCINKDYESQYTRPEMCTMMFAVDAAYSPEDCACKNNLCINKNLGKSSEQIETESSSECSCPEGYRKEGEVCNPECYYSEPPCLAPSVMCE